MRQRMTMGILAGVLVLAAGSGCRTFSRPAENKGQAGSPGVATNAPAQPAEPAPVRTVQRPHLKFRTEQDAGEYLVLAAKKQAAVNDYRTLNRLFMGKAVEVQAINEALQKNFKIAPGLRCDYNADTRTITAIEDDGKGGTVKRELFQLPDAEAEKTFTRLLEARKQGLTEANTINGVMMRTEKELIRLQKVLAEDYSLARDREYELVPKTRLLIEKVPVPERFELEGD